MLSPEIIILLIVESLVMVFGAIAFAFSLHLVSQFNPLETTEHQYRLINRTYLTSSIIQFILIVKLISFPLFIFALDELSLLTPGAMCAVGVTTSSTYGTSLLALKLALLFTMGLWLMIHREDNRTLDYKFSRSKYKLFGVIFAGLTVEAVLTGLYFMDLDLDAVVSCCGTVFNPLSSSLGGRLLLIPNDHLLWSLFIVLAISLFAASKKDGVVTGIANALFLILGLISITGFFSTYIYELPTHQCPFCLLQKEYGYIGYLLYPTLLAGTFFGMMPATLKLIIKQKVDTFRLSIILNLVFIILASAYPIFYFIRNGVWL